MQIMLLLQLLRFIAEHGVQKENRMKNAEKPPSPLLQADAAGVA
jgi:hypothetical protein